LKNSLLNLLQKLFLKKDLKKLDKSKKTCIFAFPFADELRETQRETRTRAVKLTSKELEKIGSADLI
jgi:hypothetical protein